MLPISNIRFKYKKDDPKNVEKIIVLNTYVYIKGKEIGDS